MDLIDPELRFDRMAEAMGVPSTRVERPEDLARVLREAFEHRAGRSWSTWSSKARCRATSSVAGASRPGKRDRARCGALPAALRAARPRSTRSTPGRTADVRRVPGKRDAARGGPGTGLYEEFLHAFAPERAAASGRVLPRRRGGAGPGAPGRRRARARASAARRRLPTSASAWWTRRPAAAPTRWRSWPRGGRSAATHCRDRCTLDGRCGCSSRMPRRGDDRSGARGWPIEERDVLAAPVALEAPIVVCLGNPPITAALAAIAGTRKGGWSCGATLRPLDDFSRPARACTPRTCTTIMSTSGAGRCGRSSSSAPGPGIVSFVTAASYLRGPAFAGMRAVAAARVRRAVDRRPRRRPAAPRADRQRLSDPHAGRDRPWACATPSPTRPPGDGALRSTGGQPRRKTGAPRRRRQSGRSAVAGRRADALDGAVRRRAGSTDYQTLAEADRAVPVAALRRPAQADLADRANAGRCCANAGSGCSSCPPTRAREPHFGQTRDRTLDFGAVATCADRTQRLTPAARAARPVPRASQPVPYAYRSFDRQWVLPDARLGDFMRPALWRIAGPRQIFLTSLLTNVLGPGPAAVATAWCPTWTTSGLIRRASGHSAVARRGGNAAQCRRRTGSTDSHSGYGFAGQRRSCCWRTATRCWARAATSRASRTSCARLVHACRSRPTRRCSRARPSWANSCWPAHVRTRASRKQRGASRQWATRTRRASATTRSARH